MASAGIVVAQKADEKGKEMTYTGCVAPGKDASTFVLTDVAVSGGAGAAADKKEAAPKVVTLSSTSVKIDPHTGHKVTVTGPTTTAKSDTMMTVTALKMVSTTCP
jgi:hypothetical protein